MDQTKFAGRMTGQVGGPPLLCLGAFMAMFRPHRQAIAGRYVPQAQRPDFGHAIPEIGQAPAARGRPRSGPVRHRHAPMLREVVVCRMQSAGQLLERVPQRRAGAWPRNERLDDLGLRWSTWLGWRKSCEQECAFFGGYGTRRVGQRVRWHQQHCRSHEEYRVEPGRCGCLVAFHLVTLWGGNRSRKAVLGPSQSRARCRCQLPPHKAICTAARPWPRKR